MCKENFMFKMSNKKMLGYLPKLLGFRKGGLTIVSPSLGQIQTREGCS